MSDIVNVMADTMRGMFHVTNGLYKEAAQEILAALSEKGYAVVKTHPQYVLFRGIGVTSASDVTITDNICFNSAEEREAWEKTPEGREKMKD